MYPALYYDGKTAVPRAVRIAPGASPTAAAGVLLIRGADSSLSKEWPGAGIVPAGSLDDFPIRLRRKQDTGERLLVDQPESAHFIAAWLGPQLRRARARRIWKWAVAAALAWAGFVLVWLNMNAVMSAMAALVPESWEHGLGRQSKEQVARMLALTPVGEIPWCTGSQGEAALAELVERLIASDPHFSDGAPLEVSVLDSGVVNAFALPGRHIVLTSAMLDAAETPDQLAGVLAHELGHVSERHSLKRVIRAYGLGVLFQMLAGQGELLNAVGGLGNTLVESRFSREDEALADALAVARLQRAGVDPAALADLFEALYQEEKQQMGELGSYLNWEYFSDHPAFAKRIADIRSRSAGGADTVYLPALDQETWSALQGICSE